MAELVGRQISSWSMLDDQRQSDELCEQWTKKFAQTGSPRHRPMNSKHGLNNNSPVTMVAEKMDNALNLERDCE